jgi:hypothetical protein
MRLPTTHLGGLEVTRFIIGGNPFSGFSHQSRECSAAMTAWYTDERIVETLFQAEALGLTALICRADEHMVRVLAHYRAQGGAMRWIAQTDSRAETAADGARYCLDHGAAACYLHGGIADHYVAQGRYDQIIAFIETVRAAGVPAGVAGHMPDVFRWAEAHLPPDFYMTCYYNPSPRHDVPHHDPAAAEEYLEADREERVGVIAGLSRPAIHYKILAAGRLDPAEALSYATAHMRPQDAVCVGVYTQQKPDMLTEDARLFLNGLRAVGQYTD